MPGGKGRLNSSVSSKGSTSSPPSVKSSTVSYKWGAVSPLSEKELSLKDANLFFNFLMGLVAKEGADEAKFSRVVPPSVGVAPNDVEVTKAVKSLLARDAHLIFVVRSAAVKDELPVWLSNIAGSELATIIMLDQGQMASIKGKTEAKIMESVGHSILTELKKKKESQPVLPALPSPPPMTPRRLQWAVISTVPVSKLSHEGIRKFFASVLFAKAFYGNWEREPLAVELAVERQEDYKAKCRSLVAKHPGLDMIWTCMGGESRKVSSGEYGWKKAIENELLPTLSQGILAVNVATHFGGRKDRESGLHRLSGTVQTKFISRITGITEEDKAAKLREHQHEFLTVDSEPWDS